MSAEPSAERDYKALFELYKRAFDNFLEVTCRYDSDWLQAHDDDEMWPCEPCVRLHKENVHGIYSEPHTCSRCKKTMCYHFFRAGFVNAKGELTEAEDGEKTAYCCDVCKKENEDWKKPTCLQCQCEIAREDKGQVIECACGEITCPCFIKEYHSDCAEQRKKAKTEE